MKTIKYILILFLSLTFLKVDGQVCVGESGKVTLEIWRELFDYRWGELTGRPNFPNTPDANFTLYKTQSLVNYDNYYGSRMRGFISVPQSDSVQFNLTGNYAGEFFLSTDESPDNLSMLATHPSSTSSAEHDKYPEQTSPMIYMEVGKYYYFEILFQEGSSSDFSYLYWKTPFLPSTDWAVITATYLSDIGCLTPACPPRGTSCDDGDATTTNDIEDGNCNCMGDPTTTDTCIGQRSIVERFQYNDISGSNINGLYNDPNFPAMPGYTELFNYLGQSDKDIDNVGNLIKGYLAVPETGSYSFNLTADDQTYFFLSSNEDPANKTDTELYVSGWSNMNQHDKYSTQTSSPVTLEQGKYYYIEINHKQGGGGNHFQVFWKRPNTDTTYWKRITSDFVYDYECDIACIPKGTPCDDGDPFTNGDRYNDFCECIGQPCSGADCDDPLASYVPFEKCGLTDQLDNNPANNWLSCVLTANPNPVHPAGHWIQYDLGQRHQLLNTHIWNYNVANETSKGFESVIVDYSEDGTTWSNLGTFNWPLADGSSAYGGFVGPDFNGIYARYVVFTSMSSSQCKGIGKVAFSAVLCPLEGTACDDEDPTTVDDKYDGSCECKGTSLYDNDCIEEDIFLGDSTLYSSVYSAKQEVTSISSIDSNSYVGFIGGESVLLDVGFDTREMSNFVASIDPCSPALIDDSPEGRRIRQDTKDKYKKSDNLQVIAKPNTDIQFISYYIEKPERAKIEIFDSRGQLITILHQQDYINKGYYYKKLRTKKLPQGNLKVLLTTDSKQESKPMIVKKISK